MPDMIYNGLVNRVVGRVQVGIKTLDKYMPFPYIAVHIIACWKKDQKEKAAQDCCKKDEKKLPFDRPFIGKSLDYPSEDKKRDPI
jgi:hypothetical protein